MSELSRNPALTLRWEKVKQRLGSRFAAERDAFDDIYEVYDTGWERFARVFPPRTGNGSQN